MSKSAVFVMLLPFKMKIGLLPLVANFY